MSEHQDETDMKRAENMKKVVDDMMKEMDNMSGLEITSFLDDQSLIGSADVLVSTKFKDSSQTSEDQIRTGSVADAIRRGLNIAEKARATKITIVIEKGNYEEVFPEPFSFTTLPDEFTLEVIGSGHVNLICLENPLQICCVNAKGIGNSQDDKDNCSGPDDCTKTVIFKNIIIFNQMKTSKSVVRIRCVNTKLVKVSFHWPCDSGIELIRCKAQFALCIFYLWVSGELNVISKFSISATSFIYFATLNSNNESSSTSFFMILLSFSAEFLFHRINSSMPSITWHLLLSSRDSIIPDKKAALIEA